MSTQDDYDYVLGRAASPASGMTLCTGSFGARHDNDLPGMVKRFGPKIHFAHLRNVHKEGQTSPSSFYEDEHLAGDTDMVAVISALLDEEARRKQEGRADAVIPMRPDHGQDILDDFARGAQPGYPAIGRLKGLAELRGVEKALARRPVREVMLSPVPAVSPDTDLRRVASALLDTGLPGLPVTDESGALIGFVSRSDILQAVAADPPLDLWS